MVKRCRIWGLAIVIYALLLAVTRSCSRLLLAVTDIWQIYALQILMGVFGAMQKTCEKALLADMTEVGRRGEQLGRYHVGVSICSGLAVMAGGILIDLFTTRCPVRYGFNRAVS